jgi:hypothetical protein
VSGHSRSRGFAARWAEGGVLPGPPSPGLTWETLRRAEARVRPYLLDCSPEFLACPPGKTVQWASPTSIAEDYHAAPYPVAPSIGRTGQVEMCHGMHTALDGCYGIIRRTGNVCLPQETNEYAQWLGRARERDRAGKTGRAGRSKAGERLAGFFLDVSLPRRTRAITFPPQQRCTGNVPG